MSFKTIETVLASAVADDGTVTLAYPAGTAQADFTGSNASATGVAVVGGNAVYRETDDDGIALSYGGSNITLTNESTTSWPAGSTLTVQLGQAGADRPAFAPAPAIDDVDAASSSYAQAEANASVDAINQILDVMRSKGLIASS